MRMFDAEKGFTDLAPRRTNVTWASLHMHAGFCRDQAIAIAGLSSGQLVIERIADLDAEIREIERRLMESAPVAPTARCRRCGSGTIFGPSGTSGTRPF